MSRDIFAWLEREPSPPSINWWDLTGEVQIIRNPLLFTLLGRPTVPYEDVTPIVTLRGLPPLLSDTVKEQWHELGGVEESYATYEELKRVQDAYAATDGSWYEGRLLLRTEVLLDPDWQIFDHPPYDVPLEVQMRLREIAGPKVITWEDYRLAVRRHATLMNPHLTLAAIIAFLGVYEERGIATRMVFWFQ